MGLIDFVVKRVAAKKLAEFLARAKNWPSAKADVVDWQVVEGEPDTEDADKYQVQGTLGLSIRDRRIYGVVRSVGMIHGEARNLVREGKLPTRLSVQYDADDLDEMIASPQPGELPFEVRYTWTGN